MKIISGIYQIKNKYNGKIYIGKTNNLHRRKKEHFRALKKGTHTCKAFQSDYNNATNKNNFEISLLNNQNTRKAEITEMKKIGKSNLYNYQDLDAIGYETDPNLNEFYSRIHLNYQTFKPPIIR